MLINITSNFERIKTTVVISAIIDEILIDTLYMQCMLGLVLSHYMYVRLGAEFFDICTTVPLTQTKINYLLYAKSQSFVDIYLMSLSEYYKLVNH